MSCSNIIYSMGTQPPVRGPVQIHSLFTTEPKNVADIALKKKVLLRLSGLKCHELSTIIYKDNSSSELLQSHNLHKHERTFWVAIVNQTTFSTSLSVSYNVTRIFWLYRLRHLQHSAPSTTTHTYTHSPSKWIRHSLSDAVNILNFSASRGVCIFLWGKWRPLGQGLIPVCALNLGPVSGSKPIPGVSKLFSKWARFDEVNIGEGQGHFLNH